MRFKLSSAKMAAILSRVGGRANAEVLNFSLNTRDG